jgi:hypothetical protein
MKTEHKYFYYVYAPDLLASGRGKPMITVCLLKRNGNISRGVAICSLKDNPKKKTGRSIAYRRALYALNEKKDACPIYRHEAWQSISRSNFIDVDIFHAKAKFLPSLIEYEKKILRVEI